MNRRPVSCSRSWNRRPRLEALEDRLLLSSEPTLLKDLNLAPQSGFPAYDSLPNDSLTIGNVCYFAASDSLHGSQLWRSDGTAAGTFLVKVINPDGPARPHFFTNVNGTLFFAAQDYQHGQELWKSDGTEAGTVLVKDIYPGYDSSIQSQTNPFTACNGRLFFPAIDSNPISEREWVSDGTADGTHPLTGFPGVFWGSVVLGDRLYFGTGDTTSGGQLWVTDGTPQGTQLVKDTHPGDPSAVVSSLWSAESLLFFTVGIPHPQPHAELWRSDGTPSGTFELASLAGSLSAVIAAGDGVAYFSATDPTTGAYALWKSDGTAAGTVVAKDVIISSVEYYNFIDRVVGGVLLFKGDADTLWRSDGTAAGTYSLGVRDPLYLDTVGGTVYVRGSDDVHGHELWRTDSTPAGTALVSDINPAGDGLPFELLSDLQAAHAGGTLFFLGDDGIHGKELWQTSGSAPATLVKDINPGSDSSAPRFLQALHGTILFAATEPVHGTELWQSDGTAAGTVLVRDLNTGTWDSLPRSFTLVGSTVYFHTDEGLWRTDGTTAGTQQLGVFPYPPPPPLDPQVVYYRTPREILPIGGTVYFGTEDATHGAGLWKTDGTPAGTVLVKAIGDGNFELVRNLVNVNGTLLFTVGYQDRYGQSVVQLWRSDGTEAGTVRIKDIHVLGSYETPTLVRAGDVVYFAAGTVWQLGGTRLWRSDGTEAGTTMVQDSASPTALNPTNLTVLNGTLYFTTFDPSHSSELWKSDGTAAGTTFVTNLVPGTDSTRFTEQASANGSLFLSATTEGHPGLWKSDGTAAGTVLLVETSLAPSHLTAVGSLLFFAVGNTLWRSDGTAAGTTSITAIGPSDAYDLEELTNAADTLYFSANDGVHGRELWQSDGTAAGTYLVADLFPAAWSSNPVSLRAIGNTLYFAADDGPHGVTFWPYGAEPWIVQVPYSLHERLVRRLYEDLLHREADAAGLIGWSGLLDHGVAAGDIARAIERSPEYRTQAVDGLYQVLLDRGPDPAGQAAALDYLAAGGTLEQIRNSILASAEYLAGHGHGTTEGFLRALYQDLLGRGIDPVGLQNWQALMAGGLSRATVVTSIAGSGEGLRHEVDQAYAQTLHRTADSAGGSGWADYLQAGHDTDDLLVALVSSQEYFFSALAQPP